MKPKRNHSNREPLSLSIVLTPRQFSLPFFVVISKKYYIDIDNNESAAFFIGRSSRSRSKSVVFSVYMCAYDALALSNASKSFRRMRFMEDNLASLFSASELNAKKKMHTHKTECEWPAASSFWLCTITNGSNKVTEFIINACYRDTHTQQFPGLLGTFIRLNSCWAYQRSRYKSQLFQNRNNTPEHKGTKTDVFQKKRRRKKNSQNMHLNGVH